MKRLAALLLLAMPAAAWAQMSNDDVHKYDHTDQGQYRNEIVIPGFDGYQTLKCDFHIHTCFSDGTVWPSVRVHEAWQEGLDAIAMTDHLEYRPFDGTVKADHNASYEIAKAEAERMGFILIKGAEITRSKPLGHMNAIFIKDAEKLYVDDPLKAIDVALEQGGYIIWNHPGWPDNKSTMYEVHEKLIAEGKISAYELYNYMESYPLTFDWYEKYDIAPMANTDIHGPVAQNYASGPDWHRPMTLVFATERSEEAIREALDARRTLAYFHGTLVGNADYLAKLLTSSLKVRKIGDNRMEVTNISDITYTMTQGDALYVFPAGKTAMVPVLTGQLTVKNCLYGHNKNLEFTF